MKKAAKIIIKGSVQGVFFRDFVKENAESLGVNGFVRNIADGGVEVIAEGEIEDIDRLFELCKKGPKHSLVKETIIEEIPFQDFTEFKVLHI